MTQTLEITTVIGCPMECKFCPQNRLLEAYNSPTQRLSFDNFKKAIDKIPRAVRIDFSGMAEPWLNQECTKMVLYTHQRGHPIAIYTTAVGMSLEDVNKLSEIPFEKFVLHLPDLHGNAKIPVNKTYKEVVAQLKSPDIEVMTMGTIHPEIFPIYGHVKQMRMHSRAGNVKDLIQYDHGPGAICKYPDGNRHNVLLPNGQIIGCCMDYSMEHILGNLFEQTYEDILPEENTYFDLCRYCINGRTK